jgi:hypothetical protein
MVVDNEPEPFWNGEGEENYIARWKKAVGFRHEEWGEVAGVGNLNGSSGPWVDDNVLEPLKAGHDEVFITDCVDTYFASNEGAKRIANSYMPFAKLNGLRVPDLAPHPSEGAIVMATLNPPGKAVHLYRARRACSSSRFTTSAAPSPRYRFGVPK